MASLELWQICAARYEKIKTNHFMFYFLYTYFFFNTFGCHYIPFSCNVVIASFRSLVVVHPCVSLIVHQSVRLASGVQRWSCSQSSCSPSRSVLAGQKHCLIRHWGRWPPPIFFSAKQASLLAPHLLWWGAKALLQQPFFSLYFLCWRVGVWALQSPDVTLPTIFFVSPRGIQTHTVSVQYLIII